MIQERKNHRDARNRAYREANRVRLAEKQRAYYETHRDECLARGRAWREANREKLAEYFRTYQVSHREECNAKSLAWAKANPEKIACSQRAYHESHPEKGAENGARRRARKAAAPRIEKIDRAYVYERDGGKCHICSKKATRQGFHLDHLIPLSRGGSETHDNLAVAHPICNARRGDGRLPAQLLLVG